MKVLLFGAGNIGRGFIGKLLAEHAGTELIFADVAQPLIDQLNQQGGYPVETVGEQQRTEWVRGITALNSRFKSEALIQAVVTADIITTAVGVSVLHTIADIIADGLVQRESDNSDRYLNIIACENTLKGSTQLKRFVFKNLPPRLHTWVEKTIGFVDAVVDRIIPPTPKSVDDLGVRVEPFSEWIIDRTQIKGDLPEISGLEQSDHLTAFVERKLFTLNTGHAMTAYLGYLSGHETIRQAILDPEIAKVVHCAMQESGAVLIKHYGFDPQQHALYIDKIINRFKNPWLQDEVTRVGREPLRKLGAEDRLIKPLVVAFKEKLPYDSLLKGVVAALCYHDEEDPEAVRLQQEIKQQGVETVLNTYCGLKNRLQLVDNISVAYRDQIAGSSKP